MYSIFLPFAAVVVDLCVAYIYFKHNWWLGGGTTALIALIPLFIIAFLLYSGWSRLKQATVFLGFLHSGTQLLFQVTLLFKHWNEFGDVIIEYGTMKSPQYSIVMVSCIFSSLVVAKSARECHFLCQAPEKNHVAASHFRATPFFLLHTSFRAISLGLIGAFFPLYPWSWYTIMVLFLLINFFVSFKMFKLPLPNSLLTSFTAVLTPSLYPSDTAVHIAFIANFHILNSVTTTAMIAVCALVQFLTADLHFEWNRVKLTSFWETMNQTRTDPCLAASADCSMPYPEVASLPYLFRAGILPPLLLASIVYVLAVILTMGIIRPGFLELPPGSPAAAPPSPVEEETKPDSRVRSISLDESRYKVTFGRGSAPYLATLPTIFSEEEESGILNNNNRTGAVNRNQLDSTSSDTMALSAEEVEEVVRLVEGEVEAKQQLRNKNNNVKRKATGASTDRLPATTTTDSMDLKLEYRLSQFPTAPETDLV